MDLPQFAAVHASSDDHRSIRRLFARKLFATDAQVRGWADITDMYRG